MTRRQRLARVLWIAAIGLDLWLIGGAVARALYEREPVVVPAYPGATDVRVETVPYGPPGEGSRTLTTFATSDSPAAVREFYRARLDVRGLGHWDYTPSGADSAVFSRGFCPGHVLTIVPVAVDGDRTTIRLAHGIIVACQAPTR